MKDLEIREFIDQIIKELKNTVEERKKKNKTPFFNINNVEIEIHTKVKKLADGALNISVVQVGSELSKEDTHQVKISLTPIKEMDFKKMNHLDDENGGESNEKDIGSGILPSLEQKVVNDYGVTEALDVSKMEILKLEEIDIDKLGKMFNKIQTFNANETSSFSISFKADKRDRFEYFIAKIPQKTGKTKRK